MVEVEEGRAQVTPLTRSARAEVQASALADRLPRDPVATGVASSEDSRSLRWRGKNKDERGVRPFKPWIVRGPLPLGVEQ